MKVILGNSSGVNFHRLWNPMRHFQDVDFVREVTEPTDIVLYNVRGINQSLDSIYRLKNLGTKIWVDIDDWIERPEWHGNRHPNEKQKALEILEHLKLADIVTCASKNLQTELKKLNIESHFVHNYIDIIPEKKEHELTMGWIGGSQHHIDFKELGVPLYYPYKARRVLGAVYYGHNADTTEYWAHMERVFSGNYQHEVKTFNWTTPDEYMNLYAEIDIKLLPSHNDVYTRCKSNLKVLESAMAGIPIITNGGTYNDLKLYQAYRVDGQREWRKGIEKLISSQRMRKELAQGANDYAIKFSQYKSIEFRNQIINFLKSK
jgi:glycosyltransferase involved in cell wall biosynthesis